MYITKIVPVSKIHSNILKGQSIEKNVRCYSTSPNQKVWRKLFEEQQKKHFLGAQDWYQFDIKNFDEKAKEILKKEFNGSLYRALSTLFPETDWHPWKFQHGTVPRFFWKELSNQRKFFDELGKKLGVNSLDDWYNKLSASI